MKKLLGLIVIGLFLGGPAVHHAAAQDTPKVEVSGGYQYAAFKASGDDSFEKFPAGWYADVAFNATPIFAIVGNVGGNYKTIDDEDFTLKVHEFLLGVRLGSHSNAHVVPFGQVLVGGGHLKASGGGDSISESRLSFLVGGGVNVMASRSVGFRAGLDYLRFASKDNSEIADDAIFGYRFVVGLVLAR